jgi:hypothetical protein
MAQQNRTERKRAKGAATKPETESAASPMGRFRSLTKRLLSVPRDELREKEREYRESRDKS